MNAAAITAMTASAAITVGFNLILLNTVGTTYSTYLARALIETRSLWSFLGVATGSFLTSLFELSLPPKHFAEIVLPTLLPVIAVYLLGRYVVNSPDELVPANLVKRSLAAAETVRTASGKEVAQFEATVAQWFKQDKDHRVAGVVEAICAYLRRGDAGGIALTTELAESAKRLRTNVIDRVLPPIDSTSDPDADALRDKTYPLKVEGGEAVFALSSVLSWIAPADDGAFGGASLLSLPDFRPADCTSVCELVWSLTEIEVAITAALGVPREESRLRWDDLVGRMFRRTKTRPELQACLLGELVHVIATRVDSVTSLSLIPPSGNTEWVKVHAKTCADLALRVIALAYEAIPPPQPKTAYDAQLGTIRSAVKKLGDLTGATSDAMIKRIGLPRPCDWMRIFEW